MLEGAFASHATMAMVYAFVKASLVEEVQSQAFILCALRFILQILQNSFED